MNSQAVIIHPYFISTNQTIQTKSNGRGVAQVDGNIAIARGKSDWTYRTKSLRTTRPRRVVALPIGCLAYWTARMGFGVALRLIDPAVLRTGCIARRTGLGNSPRRKLILRPPSSSSQ